MRAIWLAADQPCSKRLKALWPLWLPHHEKARGAVPAGARERLLAMSPATMDRLLRPWRVQAKRRRPAQPGRLLRTQIPVRAHVEQKQWTHVRQLLGYDRLDDPALVGLADALYIPWRLLKNFFMPTMKLQKSWREAAKIKRA